MIEQPQRQLGDAHPQPQKPRLLFFYSDRSGKCRRTEGYIAQALQRRHNHETFDFVRVSVDSHPDLAERFHVDQLPTLFVIEGRIAKQRIVSPRGVRELEQQLRPWLR